LKKEYSSLVAAAKKAMKNAYAPYSKFKVGAAVLGGSGKIYAGVNVENASYGLTVCAERNAVAAAAAAGEKRIKAVAVAADTSRPTPPCGACRQVLAEFCGDADVILAGRKGIATRKLSALLPEAFK
jgi:cytidine deaminase